MKKLLILLALALLPTAASAQDDGKRFFFSVTAPEFSDVSNVADESALGARLGFLAPANSSISENLFSEIALVGIDSDIESGPFTLAGVDFPSQKLETTQIGLDLGLRYEFDTGSSRFQPYLGAGLSLASTEVKLNGTSGSDNSAAFYGLGGVGYQLTDSFGLDLSLRFTDGHDVDAFGGSEDMDSVAFAIGGTLYL